MLRTRSNSEQIHLVEAFLPQELKVLPPDLSAISCFLDDERFFAPYRAHFNPIMGRPSIPIETYLRMMYLKFSYSLGYETVVKEVTDSITWRRFARIGLADQVPHPTTLSKITRRVGEGVILDLNRTLRAKLREQKLIRSRTLRADTTVMEADVSHPTDAGLLARGVGAMGRAVRAIKKAGGAARTAFRDRRRSAGKRMRALTGGLRTRTEEGKTTVERLTKELSDLARKAKRQAEKVLTNAARKLSQDPTNGKLIRAIATLRELIERLERVLYQTALRLSGQTVIPDRLVSLSDPDARPIKRGKLSHPVEFGYKAMIVDGKEGFIEAYDLYVGNPVDHELLGPVIDSYIEEVGRAPQAVTADRGFGLAEVEDDLKQKGVRTVAIQRRGKQDAERKQLEKTPHFNRLVRWRTGSEGRISALKRGFCGRRTRFKGEQGAKTWIGFGVFAHNLKKLAGAKRE